MRHIVPTRWWLPCVSLTLSLLGTTTAQWSSFPDQNNVVCSAAGNQTTPTAIGDGDGGLIVAWADGRAGSYDIYVQRISPTGRMLWASNGVPVCTAPNTQTFPVLISDGEGGAIISWLDYRSNVAYDIYAQRVDHSGTMKWTINGVAICLAPGPQGIPAMISDGNHGAILTWTDGRYTRPLAYQGDIFAQRIDGSGTNLWPTDGVRVCPDTMGNVTPVATEDGSGGAIISWRRLNPDVVYAQHLSATGSILWDSTGVAIGGPGTYPGIAPDGRGGAYIAWNDFRGGGPGSVFAQHVDASGKNWWTVGGESIGIAGSSQESPRLIPDNSGGAIVTWSGHGPFDFNIFARRIDAEGRFLWDSIAVCTYRGDQRHPVLTSDGNGGAVIAWVDTSGGSDDVYAQHMDGDGVVRWSASGVPVGKGAGHQNSPTIVSDGHGGAFVAWSDSRWGAWDIYAQRLDPLGNCYPAPWIQRVGDVANDQGGKLRLLWDPSSLDTWGQSTIASYTVKMGVRASGILGKSVAGTAEAGLYWQTAAVVEADWSPGYSSIISTSSDSGLQGIPLYYFQVWASSGDGSVIWYSNIDSAYSVDNIPPVGIVAPSLWANGNGNIVLRWNRNDVDPDLMGYKIYRSRESGFAAGASTYLASTQDTVFVDETALITSGFYYRIAAEDVHGNVGPYTSPLSYGTTGIDESIPLTLDLHQNFPNPFNPATRISFTLPTHGEVRIEICDLLGRTVRVLVHREMSPGHHMIEWDGKSATGTSMPTGVYICRLSWLDLSNPKPATVRTRKLSLVR